MPAKIPGGLAIFDFDGTLIPNPSSEWRFVYFLVRRKRLRLGDLAHSIVFAARWWPRYGRQVMKKNKAYLGGMKVTEAEALAREFVAEILLPLLRPAVLARLRQHQTHGDTVALLTGAPSFIAQPICEALAIRHCIACECEISDGHFLPLPPHRHPFGEEKLVLAQRLCEKLGRSMKQVTAYADSIHDRALLVEAGVPVAVSPDGELARLARQQNWPVLMC